MPDTDKELTVEQKVVEMTNEELLLLRHIWEHFDGIADGALDASYPAKMALTFSEPLAHLIARVESQSSEARMARAWNASNREFDEVVAAIREGR